MVERAGAGVPRRLVRLAAAGHLAPGVLYRAGSGPGNLWPATGIFLEHFGPVAIALWLVLAFWLGAFVLILHHVQRRWGSRWAVALAPAVWLGLEFCSELYYLRFAWFTAGSVLPVSWSPPLLSLLGVYGSGAVMMGIGAIAASLLEGSLCFWRRVSVWLVILAVAGCGLVAGIWLRLQARVRASSGPQSDIHVAGLQLEFAGESEIIERLRQLAKEHPEAELVVLSEYAFVWQVPDGVKEWCRKNRRWLIAGGKEPLLPKGDFYVHRLRGQHERRGRVPAGEKGAGAVLQRRPAGAGATRLGFAVGADWPLHLLRSELFAGGGWFDPAGRAGVDRADDGCGIVGASRARTRRPVDGDPRRRASRADLPTGQFGDFATRFL